MVGLMVLILLNHFHSWTEIFIFIQFVSAAGGQGGPDWEDY